MMVRRVGINYDIVGEHGSWILLIPGGRQDVAQWVPGQRTESVER
jgi:hypothetical protein